MGWQSLLQKRLGWGRGSRKGDSPEYFWEGHSAGDVSLANFFELGRKIAVFVGILCKRDIDIWGAYSLLSLHACVLKENCTCMHLCVHIYVLYRLYMYAPIYTHVCII